MSDWKERFIIDVQYGSRFQKEVISNMIETMCKGMKEFYENRHKKNKISYYKE